MSIIAGVRSDAGVALAVDGRSSIPGFGAASDATVKLRAYFGRFAAAHAGDSVLLDPRFFGFSPDDLRRAGSLAALARQVSSRRGSDGSYIARVGSHYARVGSLVRPVDAILCQGIALLPSPPRHTLDFHQTVVALLAAAIESERDCHGLGGVNMGGRRPPELLVLTAGLDAGGRPRVHTTTIAGQPLALETTEVGGPGVTDAVVFGGGSANAELQRLREHSRPLDSPADALRTAVDLVKSGMASASGPAGADQAVGGAIVAVGIGSAGLREHVE